MAEGENRQVQVKQKAGETDEKTIASFALQPSFLAATTIMDYGKRMGELDLGALVEVLGKQIKAVKGGDMTRVEATLVTQAHTLDAIFNNLASRAINAELMRNLETYLKLGLRAQAQCRATLETISEIKQPRNVAFVKQANIANGPQQVNNGVVEEKPSPRVDKNKKAPNELLTEQRNGPQMDTKTAPRAGAKDPAMETVGTLDRPENG